MEAKEDKRYKPEREINVSLEQHEILLGILLGDGHLELASNKQSARFRLSQTIERAFYIKHLHDKFSNWNLSEIRFHEREKGDSYEFDSMYTPTLLKYHKKFYDENKKKRIPNMENEFTSRSLTFLFMDDGGVKSKDAKSVFINTYDLPREEQDKFCKFLENNFLLQAKTVLDRGDPRIFISGYSYEIFNYLLEPHILSGFEYKIPKPRSPRSRFHKKVPDEVIEKMKEESQRDMDNFINFNESPFFTT